LSELYEEHKTEHKSNPSQSLPKPVYPTSSSSNSYSRGQNNYAQNNPSNASVPVNAMQRNDMPKFSQQVEPVYQKGKNMRTPEGKPICNYCHYGNHVTRECEELKWRNERRNRNQNNYTSRNNYMGQSSNSNDARFSNNANTYGNNPGRLNALAPEFSQPFEYPEQNQYNVESQNVDLSGNGQA